MGFTLMFSFNIESRRSVSRILGVIKRTKNFKRGRKGVDLC